MSAEHALFETQETFMTSSQSPEVTWKINTDLSNIISLAEQGLLHSPKPEDKFDEEFLAYESNCPLNEW